MSELYALPEGWEYVKLTDIVGKEKTSIKRGPFGSALKKSFFVSNGYKVYEQKNAIKDDFSIGDYYIDEEKYAELKGFEVKSGDIIISCSGTIGKIAVAPKGIEEGIINQALLKLTLNNDVVETSYFVNFWIDYVNKGMSEESTKGAAIKNIASVKVLKALDIPLPPLQEQKRIVSKLDTLFEKIDKAIALHQKNMDEADVFMGSVLNEVFGELEGEYPKIIFDKVCNKITDGSHNPPKGIEDSEFVMLSSKNVFNNYINFDNPRYLKEEDFIRENKRTDVSCGDVLLTIVGTIGRTAVVNIDKKFTLQRSVAVLKPNKEILDSYFLMYSLQKNLDILTSGAKGAAQKGIYLKSIKQLEIVDVPLKTQQKTVKYLDQISEKTQKVKSVQKEKMQSLKALKASLLDRAFRGEL